MDPSFFVAFWILLGFIAAYIAKIVNKNPYLWFFIGTFVGVLGILLLLFLIRKEKQIQKKPIIEPSCPIEKFFLSNIFGNKLWYYLDIDKQTQGPMSTQYLLKKWKIGHINNNTYIWNEDMDNWEKLIKLLPTSLNDSGD